MQKPPLNNSVWRNPDSNPVKDGHIWTGIIIHHTGNPPSKEVCWTDWFRRMGRWLSTDDDVYVSSHYIISRDGLIDQLVNPKTHIAWHAGLSSFWNPDTRKWQSGCNNFMIGIELLGDGNIDYFDSHQYIALSQLVAWLQRQFSIDDNMIVGHETVSPGRKVDPGRLFDWKLFFNLKREVLIYGTNHPTSRNNLFCSSANNNNSLHTSNSDSKACADKKRKNKRRG